MGIELIHVNKKKVVPYRVFSLWTQALFKLGLGDLEKVQTKFDSLIAKCKFTFAGPGGHKSWLCCPISART